MFSFLRSQSGSESKNTNAVWMLSTLVLGIVFIGFLVYEFQPRAVAPTTPGQQGQNLPGTTTPPAAPTGPVVTLPITIVYNADVPDQKKDIKIFVDSLVDPKTGLQSTKLQDSWIDYRSKEGKSFIDESDALYLPVVFFDKNVEQHPQFKAIAPYTQKKGEHYYFHLRPLQHLKTPPLTGAHFRGTDSSRSADSSRGKVKILEYGSYTCHFCRQMEEVLTKILKDYDGVVSLAYKHYDRGGFDSMLAQSSECANEEQKFWEMHDLLFSDQDTLIKAITGELPDGKTSDVPAEKRVRTYLEEKAKTLGLNVNNFNQCLDSKKYAKAVQNSTAEAGLYGINGTPGFFINQKFSDGASSYEDFKVIVESQIRQED